MKKTDKIYIAGHKGMVGSGLLGLLEAEGYSNIIFRTSEELDLRVQADVDAFMKGERPEYVFLLAARIGGIKANIKYPVEFLSDNLMIAINLINASYKYRVKKLLFLGSSCIYPRNCPQPMKEEYLLNGKFEPTNEGYALAKTAGLKLCEYYNKEFNTNFISLLPCSIYGIRDNFDLENSHVVAGLIRKFLEARINNFDFVEIWGKGEARREFLFAEDAARACLYFMGRYNADELPGFINIGFGQDISIKELVFLIKEKVGYRGDIKWNIQAKEGMPQKLLDSTLAKRLGWRPQVSLKEGLLATVKWYKEQHSGIV